MTNPDPRASSYDASLNGDAIDSSPACVLCFNSNDPVGAGGLGADAVSIAAVGAHALCVSAGTYLRDTTSTHQHIAMDCEAVAEQALAVVQDVEIGAIKAGFVGTAANVAALAETASDYDGVPMVAYMPDVFWMDEAQADDYLEAFAELVLPLCAVLVGNRSTLVRWLLPDWDAERGATARDIARAASELGTPYVLVTGIVTEGDTMANVLASAQQILLEQRFERIGARFVGAGDTLSAALAALLATGMDLPEAAQEALSFLDGCLDAAFRPGMGRLVPDRMFWAQPETEATDEAENGAPSDLQSAPQSDPQSDTQHAPRACLEDTNGFVTDIHSKNRLDDAFAGALTISIHERKH